MQDDRAELTARVEAWMRQDPDDGTRRALADLLAKGESGELAGLFAGTLEFGTAGLRGELGPGPLRMNRVTVMRAAAGLASHLRAHGHDGGLVVVGYDARHRSADFARDTASVLTGAGLRAAVLPRALPTPVLAFAVRELGAAAGVMVTASHNPPRDNGYKVYLSGGSQLVPPDDADIAARIADVPPLTGLPLPEEGWEVLGEEIVEAYLTRATGVLDAGSPRGVRTVHTALHGVGGATLREAFVRAGFPAPVPVAEQAEPDPDFPTVAFPNPEEPGAMDLAFATARAEAPDLVLANDPDADRCAVAVPDAAAEGGWRMLRGDEVGALLAWHLVRRGVRGTLATTIVSSSLLSRLAAAAGLPHTETLTGFKWLARVEDLGYAYEEALGYCADPGGVRDKDGVTAALLVAELAAGLTAEGRTLTDVLDDIAREHGVHATDQLSVRVEDLGVIAAAMERLRAEPPARLAGLDVTSAEDLRESAGGLPPTDGLRYRLGDGAARVVVRPSGTEPKLKCYLEAVVPVTGSLEDARTEAGARLTALRRDLSEAAGL